MSALEFIGLTALVLVVALGFTAIVLRSRAPRLPSWIHNRYMHWSMLGPFDERE